MVCPWEDIDALARQVSGSMAIIARISCGGPRTRLGEQGMFANSALAVSNPTRKLVAAHSSMRYAHAHHLRAPYAPCRPEEVTIIPREEG